jgi:hypothetical protein
MNKIKKISMNLLLSVAATVGCFGQSPDVYITINEYPPERGTIAGLWKNGAIQDLSEGRLGTPATSVFVSGDDVYVGGGILLYDYENPGERWDEYGPVPKTVATIWKNGVAQHLTDKESPLGSVIYSLYVSDSDVYAVGFIYNSQEEFPIHIAATWKNGELTVLTDGTNHAAANSVFVLGNDVYVAGLVRSTGRTWEARLWKNGEEQTLLQGTKTANANSVFVSGSDVYVAGSDEVAPDRYGSSWSVATLWKNGVAQNLTDGTALAYATSVFVSDDDVYVVGVGYRERRYGNSIVKLWKNGVEQNLSDGTHDAVAHQVFVSGNDVYVVGSEYGAQAPVARLWKNGVAHALTDGSRSASAQAVFVK